MGISQTFGDQKAGSAEQICQIVAEGGLLMVVTLVSGEGAQNVVRLG
jgi:hypothetical protein